VVRAAAQLLRLDAKAVHTDDDDDNDIAGADWVLVTSRQGYFRSPLLAAVSEPPTTRKNFRPWTDDYSNLYQILKR
jgi:hypothetical protein